MSKSYLQPGTSGLIIEETAFPPSCIPHEMSQFIFVTTWDASRFYCPLSTTFTNFAITTQVLDPMGKLAYFKKNWPEHLHEDVLACAKKVVCSCVICISRWSVRKVTCLLSHKYLHSARAVDLRQTYASTCLLLLLCVSLP
jgi:hypothetical protein